MIQSSTFERHVLRFICVIGVVRMTLELYYNYLLAVPIYTWIVDASFFVFLIIALVFTFKTVNIKYLTYPVSIIGWVFFTYGWISQGGLDGRSEYNFFIYIVAMAVLHSGRTQLTFVGLGIVTQVSLLLSWHYRFEWVHPWVSGYSSDYFHFFAVMFVVAALVIYLRIRSDLEDRRLLNQETELSEKSRALDIENEGLKLQQQEFEQITKKLEIEISERKSELDEQNASLKEFLEISVKEFLPPLQGTLAAIAKMEKEYAENENFSMLIQTGSKLETAYNKLKVKMKDDIS